MEKDHIQKAIDAGGWLGLQLASCDCQKAEEAKAKEEAQKNISLEQAMADDGYTPPGNITPGKITRFRPEGRKDKSGWVWLSPNGEGAAYGDYATGHQATWTDRKTSSMTPEELDAMRKQMAEARAKAEKEREETHKKSAMKAVDIISGIEAASPTHEYLKRKKIKPFGALEDSGGNLVLPIMDSLGEITSLQTIRPDGSKKFMSGGKIAGCFIPVDAPGSETLIICEGWATGATLAEHNPGADVIAAMNAGNLPAVARAMKNRYSRIIIAGDDDKNTEGNPGRTAAEKAAKECGGVAVFPDGASGTDFNDLFCETGGGAKILESAPLPDGVARLVNLINADDDAELASIAAQQWLIDDVIPAESFVMVYGASGTGKSFAVLDMAMCIAAGKNWQSFEATGRRNVLYISAEGGRGMRIRKRAWEQKHNIRVKELRVLPVGIVMDDAKSRADLIGAIAAVGHKFDAIVLDTLARSMSGDENTVKDAGAFIRGCDEIKEKFGCALIVVHHTGKDADRGARGSSAFRAATDTEISVEGSTDTMLRIKCTKAKDVEPFPDVSLVMDKVELIGMTDYKGRPLTSLVPRPPSFGEQMQAASKIGPNDQSLLDCFGNDVMTKDEVRKAFYLHPDIAHGPAETKRRQLNKSLENLLDRALITKLDSGEYLKNE